MQWRKIHFRLTKIASITLGWFCLAGLSTVGSPPVHAFWSSSPAPPPVAVQEAAAAPIVTKEEQVQLLVAAINQMARDLTTSYHDGDSLHDPLAEGVVVSSFVELKKLSRTSSFGRYLAEQLMSELQRQGYRVVELRKSVSIRVQEQRGEYGLSRNPEEIPVMVTSGAMLAGTYTIADGYVLVNARLLDNRTTVLLASATAVFPYDNLTRTLLADRVSASGAEKTEELVYLKRLEP
jgi:TolB-like protein